MTGGKNPVPVCRKEQPRKRLTDTSSLEPHFLFQPEDVITSLTGSVPYASISQYTSCYKKHVFAEE